MHIKFKSTKLHTIAAGIWAALLAPTLLWWNQSILWVAGMSLYANFVGHLSSYEAAASAGVDQETHDKLNAIADGMADIMEVLADLKSDDPRTARLKDDARELRRVVGIEQED